MHSVNLLELTGKKIPEGSVAAKIVQEATGYSVLGYVGQRKKT